MRIICCRFGNKFTQWHVDNLKHMIDEYSGLKYDSFEVIEDDLYGNWFNKFQMYDRFRDGENLYFDLDMIIYNKLPNLVRKDFTLYYKFIDYKTYERVCPSIKDYLYYKPLSYSICTLGQMQHIMEKGWTGWYSNYFLKSDKQ
jgi:hypothetical protein